MVLFALETILIVWLELLPEVRLRFMIPYCHLGLCWYPWSRFQPEDKCMSVFPVISKGNVDICGLWGYPKRCKCSWFSLLWDIFLSIIYDVPWVHFEVCCPCLHQGLYWFICCHWRPRWGLWSLIQLETVWMSVVHAATGKLCENQFSVFLLAVMGRKASVVMTLITPDS